LAKNNSEESRKVRTRFHTDEMASRNGGNLRSTGGSGGGGASASSAAVMMPTSGGLSRFGEEMLQWLHFVVFIVFFAQAVLTIISASPFGQYKIAIPQTYNLSGKHQQEPIFLKVKTLICAYFVLVASHFLLMQNKTMFRIYKQNLAMGRNPFRWAEWSVTSSLIVVVSAILVHIRDVDSLVILFFNMVSVIICGAWAEYDTTRSLFPHLAGWVFHIYIWTILMFQYYKVATGQLPSLPTSSPTMQAEIQMLHILMPSMFILFTLYGVVQIIHMFQLGPGKNYVVVDVLYTVLSVITKTTMGFVVLHASLLIKDN
jgi:hypothetical protein